MNQYSIHVDSLEKRFGKFVAVDGISFTVEKGKIFGFLGANGAGKSTTIRMLCGLLSSTAGTATVAGFDINREPEKVKRNIGYMSQRFSLYEDLTVEENIVFFGGAYGLSGGRFYDRLKWVVGMAGLEGMEDTITGNLPGGWKQRLALGCAVLHEPEIIFLDEPTSGVDPISRRKFWELINTVSEQGATVFVTTHYLDEAEYCNNIALIHAGKLIASGSPRELKATYMTRPVYKIECNNTIQALEILNKSSCELEASMFGSYIHISIAGNSSVKDRICQLLAQNDVIVERFEPITPSLEDVFVHLIEAQSTTQM